MLLMGKLTISTGPFSIAMSVYQSVAIPIMDDFMIRFRLVEARLLTLDQWAFDTVHVFFFF